MAFNDKAIAVGGMLKLVINCNVLPIITIPQQYQVHVLTPLTLVSWFLVGLCQWHLEIYAHKSMLTELHINIGNMLDVGNIVVTPQPL